ncbi:MAG: LAGLIDADG family homing endonuclease, partial [Candidatus Norongarragalinales archaeon]
PDWVKRQDDFSASFVRGLFDTDGHIAIYAKGRFKAYPVISFKMKPKEIIADLAEVLKNLGFKAAVYFDVAQKDRRFNCKWIKNTLYLSGWRNFLLWKELIGSNNPKNLEKFRTLEEALIGLRKD